MAVHTTAQSFGRALVNFEGVGRKVARNRTKAVAIRALAEVVLATPVDTGRARGNWQVAEGQPPEGQVERFDQTGTQGQADTVGEGSREILGMSGEDIIWLHNGVPYITILEQKHKMVAGAVASLRTWIRSQR